MFEWLNWDLATTVITAAVFAVAIIVAYARGYGAGHDDGYVEAVRDASGETWARAVRDGMGRR